MLRQRAQQRLEPGLALLERQAPDVLAVEVQQVEDVVDDLAFPAREPSLQGLEARAPVRQHGSDLAVEERLRGRERGDGVADFGKARRPIVPGTGDEGDRAALDARADAIAVELDLVEPVVAVGRRLHQARELRLEAHRERGGRTAGRHRRPQGNGALARTPLPPPRSGTSGGVWPEHGRPCRTTPRSATARRMTTAAGRAYHALLDTLRDADQTFLDGPRADMDALGVAEGYRHLTHLLGYAFDLYLEGDAERPVFTPLASPTQKMLGDNVDSLYHFAPLRGDRRYRIRGQRGNEVYLAFCVYGGKPDGEWSERVVANLRSAICGALPTARFEIILGRSRGSPLSHPPARPRSRSLPTPSA